MKRLLTFVFVLALLCGCACAEQLTTNGGIALTLDELPYRTQEESAPIVYFISDISPEALVSMYVALGVELPGRVGVKMSTGESEKSNYLRPELIGDLVHLVNGTLVECNTAY
ncbi:MAG: ferredoxin, partial [Clostridia bacterium]|nr:ferredoxin [Clostridia bacterium]